MTETDINPSALHDDALVVDGTCPLLVVKDFVDWYIEGGVDVVTPTVGGFHPPLVSFQLLGEWLAFIEKRDDLRLIRSGDDARSAKGDGATGVTFHFQGTDPIDGDLRHIDAFRQLGVGTIQLTYNTENAVGYGCQVEDSGLKPFGRDLIKHCNDAGVIVDVSHTGHRTSMEAIATSESPVILSHANPRAVFETASERNATDELIAAIAESGGIMGITGFPGLLARNVQVPLDIFVDHIDHTVSVAGIDHVALSLDYYLGQHPVVDDDTAMRAYQEEVDAGRWQGPDYPPPPHKYPVGIETPKTMSNITAALLNRGYVESHVRKIVGLNWVRMYDEIWT